MQLNIIYEDKDILICFKPSGIATQTAKFSEQDMVSVIKNYLAKQGKEKLPYVGVIHRLDQPVSGLLVFAKNSKAAASLSRQIQDRNANKDYIAFCSGTLEEKQGTLIHYIQKDPVTKLAKVMSEEHFLTNLKAKDIQDPKVSDEKKSEKQSKDLKNSFKKAILTYEVEKEYEDSSIIKVHLETGRFHQIRAQFSFIGNALLGDNKYGTANDRRLSIEKGINTVALCAYCLDLKHPTTGRKMKFVLDEEYLPQWYKVIG